MSGSTPLPLAGVRVLELSHYVAAPTAGLILADLGAEVVKVEPLDGDPTRESKKNGVFFTLNRNKDSLAIDLKHPAGRDLLLRMVADYDVLFDNYVPGTLDRLGLGYEALRTVNPRLIYTEIRGFLPGPYGNRPLMDEAAQVMAGLAYMTGPPGQPMRVGASITDYGAGVWCVLGIMGALLTRARTGAGQRIDVGLYETALFWMAHTVGRADLAGEAPPPMPSVGMGPQLGITIYRLFRTRDDRSTFIAVVSDVQWERLCAEFGLDDLWQDLSLRSRPRRAARSAEIEARFEHIAVGLTETELAERLERCRVPFAPLNTPFDVLADPHLNANGGLVDVPLLDDGTVAGGVPSHIRVPGLPIRVVSGDRVTPSAAPCLGAQSRVILHRAGLADADVDELVSSGVVRG
jgi:crotonobetainyl-CoA:carnitine CoA-transferase CaiB-like acyl-CoA transferase